MKKILLAAALSAFAFATPTFAAGKCADMITKIDAALETTNAADDAKMKILELREQSAKQLAAGDEKACMTTTTAALELLAK